MATKKKPAEKRGRPAATAVARDYVLGVRLTPTERTAVEVAAKRDHRSASAWAREAVLSALGVK